MNKKTLIVGGVHGNEATGIELVRSIEYLKTTNPGSLPEGLDALIGNPEAVLANRRFIEADLNRSFAATHPVSLEECRAREIKEVLWQYELILDFHNTQNAMTTCAITVGDPNYEHFRISHHFGLTKVVCMQRGITSESPTPSLVSCRPQNAMALEIARADMGKYSAAYLIDKIKALGKAPAARGKANVYYESSLVLKSTLARLGLSLSDFADFVELNKNQRKKFGLQDYRDRFAPIFVGSTDYVEDFGFRLTRIHEVDLESRGAGWD